MEAKDPIVSSPEEIQAKYDALQAALFEGKVGIKVYRRKFTEACIAYADSLRTRSMPADTKYAESIVAVAGKLVVIRNYIVDWVLMESEALPSDDFSSALLKVMGQIRELKLRPIEVTSWNDVWFEAHKLFAYETFLYVVAALIKTESYKYLREIFVERFVRPENDRPAGDHFARFDDFYAYSEVINSVLAPPNQKLYSPAAELIKRQAGRSDIPFPDIIQADLIVLLVAFIDPEVRWYPQTLLYWRMAGSFPFFLRATQHKYFLNVATITGVNDADKMRALVKKGEERLSVRNWNQFIFLRSFDEALNLAKLDTVG